MGSDECYGQRQGLMRYYTLLILDNFEKSLNSNVIRFEIEAPCQPKSSEFSITLKEILASKCSELKHRSVLLSPQKSWTFIGTSNHSQCRQITERLFDHNECKSTFKSNCFKKFTPETRKKPKEFYAFSTYFYTSSNLDLDLNLELQASHQKTQDLCQAPFQDHPLVHLGQEN